MRALAGAPRGFGWGGVGGGAEWWRLGSMRAGGGRWQAAWRGRHVRWRSRWCSWLQLCCWLVEWPAGRLDCLLVCELRRHVAPRQHPHPHPPHHMPLVRLPPRRRVPPRHLPAPHAPAAACMQPHQVETAVLHRMMRRMRPTPSWAAVPAGCPGLPSRAPPALQARRGRQPAVASHNNGKGHSRSNDIAATGWCPLQAVKQIEWADAYYRSDIGWRAIQRLQSV